MPELPTLEVASSGIIEIPAGTYTLHKQAQGSSDGVTFQSHYGEANHAPTGGTGDWTPLVLGEMADHDFYELQVIGQSGTCGEFRWRRFPSGVWDVMTFALDVPTLLNGTATLVTLRAGWNYWSGSVGSKFRWRGGGSKSLPWINKPWWIKGAGMGQTILEFDFSESGGHGDGIVPFWSTYAQVGRIGRISDLTIRNVSTSNKAAVSTPVAFGGAPEITASGSPICSLDRYRIEIMYQGGPRGVAYFRWTRDRTNSGLGYGPAWAIYYRVPADGVFEIPGSGVKVTFPDGIFQIGHAWEFDATGYGGAAILAVGATQLTIERVHTEGWSKGLHLDGCIETRVRDCNLYGGTVADSANLDHSVGAVLSENSQYFRLAGACNCNSFDEVAAVGRYGIVDYGGTVHTYDRMSFTGSKTCMFFGSGSVRVVRDSYHESNFLAHYETDGSGGVNHLILESGYYANAWKAPLFFNRNQTIGVRLSGVCIGRPDGTTAHPYLETAAQNDSLVQTSGMLSTLDGRKLVVSPAGKLCNAVPDLPVDP